MSSHPLSPRTFWQTGFFCVCLSLFFGTSRVALAAATPTSVIPNDTFWNREWEMRQIHAPEAWATTTGTSNVIVAVIDGGVDITHPDLKENIWTNSKEKPNGKDNDGDGYVGDMHGWNFVDNSADVRPQWKDGQYDEAWSHGTIVASLIAAKGNDGIGIAGVAWNVKIIPLVVLDADGEGSTENMVKAVRYAVAHGANVINLSLVGYDPDADLDAAIREADAAGVTVVAATGNDDLHTNGINLDQLPAYPVCSDGSDNAVLGVSGTDTLDQRAPHANFGKTCTDLSAPALQLFAARPSYPHDGAATATVAGYIDNLTGTSLAAPLVSGVAALIKSIRPDFTPAQIRQRIIATADPIDPGLPADLKGLFGSGRLNAARAVQGLVPDVAIAGVHTNVKARPKAMKTVPVKAHAANKPQPARPAHL